MAIDSPSPPTSRRRRRRTPEAAEHEIIAAAQALLRERPLRELTVDEVMRRTDLSPSVLLRLLPRSAPPRAARRRAHRRRALHRVRPLGPRRGGRPCAAARRHAGIVAVFAEHGPVLRALADAAADDPDVELVYHRLVQSFIDVTARHIRLEMAAGRVHGLEPVETATALVWMMERYLTLGPAREPQPERRMLAGTLEILWARVLYGAG